jgi:hypothetical protein
VSLQMVATFAFLRRNATGDVSPVFQGRDVASQVDRVALATLEPGFIRRSRDEIAKRPELPGFKRPG